MTRFRDGFMMKSPLSAHGKELKARAMKLSKESSGRSDAPDYDNPEVVKLLDQAKKAEAEHDTPAKMSPFHGYVDGEERVSHYQPTADLYKDMIDTMTSNVDKIAAASGPEDMAKKKAMKAQRLGKRMDKIDQKFADPNYNYDDGMALDDKKRKLAKKQAEALVDQTEFENIANKNKDNQFDKLLALMSKEDKDKYGLTTDTTT